MKFDFFMIADEAMAEESPDGSRKLNIRGGGVTHVRAPAFPYQLASIAIVTRFFLEESDASSKHSFEVRVIQPDGSRLLAVGHEVDISEISSDAHAGEEASLFVVGALQNVRFEREGRYVFELALDDTVIDSKGIAAITDPDKATPEEPEAEVT